MPILHGRLSALQAGLQAWRRPRPRPRRSICADGVGGLSGLLLCLVYGLPMRRTCFRMRYRLGCALARLCRLLRVAGDGRSHGRD
jgi:hypothetical protein